jgi:hypothetical protein
MIPIQSLSFDSFIAPLAVLAFPTPLRAFSVVLCYVLSLRNAVEMIIFNLMTAALHGFTISVQIDI